MQTYINILIVTLRNIEKSQWIKISATKWSIHLFRDRNFISFPSFAHDTRYIMLFQLLDLCFCIRINETSNASVALLLNDIKLVNQDLSHQSWFTYQYSFAANRPTKYPEQFYTFSSNGSFHVRKTFVFKSIQEKLNVIIVFIITDENNSLLSCLSASYLGIFYVSCLFRKRLEY